MKRLLCTLPAFILLAGCAGEAPTLDASYGLAQEANWNQQIINPEPVCTVPAGLNGIHAEVMMQAHNQSYATVPGKVKIEKFQIP